jgi:hypothetical protein
VDRMDNAASIAFAAFPERLFVIQNGLVIYEVIARHILMNYF